MPKFHWTIVLATAASFSCHADNCEAVRTQIQSKIQAAGAANFILITSDAASPENGRIVGACANGKKKIIYLVSNGSHAENLEIPGLQNLSESSDNILTECADGSVVIGLHCPAKAAPLDN